jgi:hypothetical protein
MNHPVRCVCGYFVTIAATSDDGGGGRTIAATVLRARIDASIMIVMAEIPRLVRNDQPPAAGTSHASKRHPLRPSSPDSLVSGAVTALARLTLQPGRQPRAARTPAAPPLPEPARRAARVGRARADVLFRARGIKGSRLVQRPAVAEVARVERCPFDESFQSQALTRHVEQSGAESGDLLHRRES